MVSESSINNHGYWLYALFVIGVNFKLILWAKLFFLPWLFLNETVLFRSNLVGFLWIWPGSSKCFFLKRVYDQCTSTSCIASWWRAWPSSQASTPLAGEVGDHDCCLTITCPATAPGAIPHAAGYQRWRWLLLHQLMAVGREPSVDSRELKMKGAKYSALGSRIIY